MTWILRCFIGGRERTGRAVQKKGLSEACAGRQAKSEGLHMHCTGCHAALLDPVILGLVPGRPQSIRPCLLSGDGGGRGWEGCLRAVALGAAEQHYVGLWLVDRIVDPSSRLLDA